MNKIVKNVGSKPPWENPIENDNLILTLKYQEKIAKSIGALGTIPKPMTIVYGNGGLDGSGDPIPPQETDSGVRNEIYRKDLNFTSFPISTVIHFSGTLNSDEMNEQIYNEFAILDEEGDTVFIRTFDNLEKREGLVFINSVYMII